MGVKGRLQNSNKCAGRVRKSFRAPGPGAVRGGRSRKSHNSLHNHPDLGNAPPQRPDWVALTAGSRVTDTVKA